MTYLKSDNLISLTKENDSSNCENIQLAYSDTSEDELIALIDSRIKKILIEYNLIPNG